MSKLSIIVLILVLFAGTLSGAFLHSWYIDVTVPKVIASSGQIDTVMVKDTVWLPTTPVVVQKTVVVRDTVVVWKGVADITSYAELDTNFTEGKLNCLYFYQPSRFLVTWLPDSTYFITKTIKINEVKYISKEVVKHWYTDPKVVVPSALLLGTILGSTLTK